MITVKKWLSLFLALVLTLSLSACVKTVQPETTGRTEATMDTTEPAETKPTETEPAETEPTETEPVETEPTETEPAETEPTKTEPTETEPTETEPTETEPTETEPTETEPTEPAIPGSTPVLYKVTDEDGTVVYLLGSIHVATDDMYPLPDYVMDAYRQSDALAVECDVVAAQSNVLELAEAVQPLVYQDGSSIKDHIDEPLYDAAVEILKENNTYNFFLRYYTPSFWSSAIESLLYQKLGYDSNKGIDMFFLNMAKDEDKEILEVESVEMQYALLGSFPPEVQEYMLSSAVNNYHNPRIDDELTELVELWRSGDAEAFGAYLNQDTSAEEESIDDPELLQMLIESNDAMVGDRNINMTDYAEAALENDQNIFICVGAAHVVGEGAMADLLTQRGYTVEQVQ